MKSEQKEEDSIRYPRGMPYPSCSKDYKGDKMKGEIKGRITAIDIIWYEARRECINEVKKIVTDAIKKAEGDNYKGSYRPYWMRAEAYDIIEEKINNMK